MSVEDVQFVGVHGIAHPGELPVSKGIDFSFASLIGAYVDLAPEAVHPALVAAHLSDERGFTMDPKQSHTVELGDKTVAIEPVFTQLDAPEETEGILDIIEGSLAEDKPVLLYHKKDANPDDYSHHWILVNGIYVQHDGARRTIVYVDPDKTHTNSDRTGLFSKKIERSQKRVGVAAYSLSLAGQA